VDDGSKKEEQELNHPAANADVDAIVKYLDNKLNIADPNTGVTYALKMASEFKKSVQIVSKVLPAWDKGENLVGDVLILEKDLSCQFFLLACRRFETEKDMANGRIDNETLVMWEQLLFTRDLHENYYKLRYTDNFQGLFAEFLKDNSDVKDIISKYLADGFRFWDYTKNLQGIVRDCLKINKNQILNNAFYWWKHKMIYALYKYEKSIEAELREVVKGTISVEHILPQNWYGIRDGKDLSGETLKSMEDDAWKRFHEGIDACINGIGNLLLITPSENTSKSNYHPKDKIYDPPYSGGSYKNHDCNRGQWEDPQKWKLIIEERGERIYKYMLDNLVGAPYKKEETLSNPDGQTE